MIDKTKLIQAIATGKITDKQTLAIFAQNEELKEEIDTKIATLEKKINETVKIVKESEVNLPKVLESIRGKDGKQGEQGEKGEKGDDGYIPIKGKNYFDGKDGKQGLRGEQGEIGLKGEKGDTGQLGASGERGKDGSPDTRIQIVEKINTGKDKDSKIQSKQVENFDKLVTNDALNRAISILDQRTQFLINKKTGSTIDELVKYDSDDPTADYLSAKIVADTGITLSEGTGADENKLKITNSGVITESDPLSLHLDQTTPQTTIGTFIFPQIIDSGLTASKVVFTDTNKQLTSTGIGTSSQFIKGDGSLDSATVTAHNLLSTTHEDTTASSVARGDIIVGIGTSTTWDNLALGTVGKILRSDGTDLKYTTSTFADTYAVNTILYAGTANIITGLATGNNGVLITSAYTGDFSIR